MKINYETLKDKSRLMKSATGLNLKEFDLLMPTFEKGWQRYISRYTFEGKKRQRAWKPRKNSRFKRTEDLLILILYDYRHNETQELMGLHFEKSQAKVASWIKIL